MSRQAIKVRLPDDVYDRVERTARGMKRPVEQVLVSIVRAAMPSLGKVPPEYRRDLEALELLSDDELWKVAKTRVSAARQRRMTSLAQKNQSGSLKEAEKEEISRVRAELDRVMLRKSYAYLILKCRGHEVSPMLRLE